VSYVTAKCHLRSLLLSIRRTMSFCLVFGCFRICRQSSGECGHGQHYDIYRVNFPCEFGGSFRATLIHAHTGDTRFRVGSFVFVIGRGFFVSHRSSSIDSIECSQIPYDPLVPLCRSRLNNPHLALSIPTIFARGFVSNTALNVGDRCFFTTTVCGVINNTASLYIMS
jgi:hypothetical protein